MWVPGVVDHGTCSAGQGELLSYAGTTQIRFKECFSATGPVAPLAAPIITDNGRRSRWPLVPLFLQRLTDDLISERRHKHLDEAIGVFGEPLFLA